MSRRKKSGKIVQHEDGRYGRTYNYKGLIKGKVPVHFEVSSPGTFTLFAFEGILVEPSKLKQIGNID